MHGTIHSLPPYILVTCYLTIFYSCNESVRSLPRHLITQFVLHNETAYLLLQASIISNVVNQLYAAYFAAPDNCCGIKLAMDTYRCKYKASLCNIVDLPYKHTLAVAYWPKHVRYVPETSFQYFKKSRNRYDSKKELPLTMKKLPVIQRSYVIRLITWLYIASGRWIKYEYRAVAKW